MLPRLPRYEYAGIQVLKEIGSMSRNWTLEMVNFLNSYRAPLASLSVKIRGKNAPSFNREASTFFYKAILP